MASLTHEQQAAVQARGNVLVVAGAGTGKTRTLVQRCLSWILDEAEMGSLDRVLMVTFTEAAASEMRKRIRDALRSSLENQPRHPRLAEQLALVESAHISTLHSFCYRLIRDHFYEVNLDPQAGVLTQEQAHLLAEETLDRVIEDSLLSGAGVAELFHEYGRGRNEMVRKLVFQVYRYTQTLPDPKRWFAEQRHQLAEPNPGLWLKWYLEAFERLRSQWQPVLAGQDNDNLRRCYDAFNATPKSCARSDVSACLAKIVEADSSWPRGTKEKFQKPNRTLFQDAAFLHGYAQPHPTASLDPSLELHGESASAKDPFLEDWLWSRDPMISLLGLVENFARSYAKAKREMGMLDFHDLEQFALQLLIEPGTGGPSSVALEWRERLRLIFVDEYQDINAAQDAILSALGRESAEANRFLVGDLKQSIYRFRLADPRIFQRYCQEWSNTGMPAQTIALRENFRSHEGILNFINAIFPLFMQAETGGVNYDEEAALIFGAPQQRRHRASSAELSDPAVELCLRVKGDDGDEEGTEPEETGPMTELGDTEWEARMIAGRLKQLHTQELPVWDDSIASFRPVAFSDMVVLLRAPDKKAESFAKEFSHAGVPLQAARGGFYETSEIADMLSLLQVLDNPLQDLPLLAVLRSPMVGLSLEDLATIRLALRREPFWTALSCFVRNQPPTPAWDRPGAAQLQERLVSFTGQFARWRRLSRRAALSQCLEAILDETHYESWLAAQPRGLQRLDNIQRLLGLTRQFDQFQRQGLYRFLTFVQAQCEAGMDGESASPGTGNAVRLMSIHQSKGLEYPVVVVAGLGKRFNLRELSEPVLLDDYYGLCPQVAPPRSGRRYPSLALWLARQRQTAEIYGEEMRLLYVAMTRARDRLILAGTLTRSTLESNWRRQSPARLAAFDILKGRCSLDWLGACLSRLGGDSDWSQSGQNTLLRWRLFHEAEISSMAQGGSSHASLPAPDDASGAPDFERLSRVASWEYPFERATRESAKTSVTAFRKRVAEETDAESKMAFAFELPAEGALALDSTIGQDLSFADVGIAHHSFLEHVDYTESDEEAQLHAQVLRMIERGALTREEATCLDIPALDRFLHSKLGMRIRTEWRCVHREMPFTTRISLENLNRFLKPPANNLLAAKSGTERGEPGEIEFVVVQGVVDLAVIKDDGIWIVDYKTDRVAADRCLEKAALYSPQMLLYAAALEGIYKRPVTECWLYFLNAGMAVACERRTQPG